MFGEKVLEQLAGIPRQPRVLVANADIHAPGGFRKQPTVIRRDRFVEDHLDVMRTERDILPPAHDGLDEPAWLPLAGEAGMCPIRDDWIVHSHRAATPTPATH